MTMDPKTEMMCKSCRRIGLLVVTDSRLGDSPAPTGDDHY